MVATARIIAGGGVAVIVAGVVTIATHGTSSGASTPAPATMGSVTTRPSATASPSSARPTPAVTPTSSTHVAGKEPKRAKDEAKQGPITYVVKPGDNLWDIAEWFHLHGYGALYQWNRAVIGDNPRLIHPGQRIVVSASGNHISN